MTYNDCLSHIDSHRAGRLLPARVGRKSAKGGPQIKSDVGRLSAPQETDQETAPQETAAAESDAAALVKDLVAQDLNRADARRLARTSPDECRRQLEYLTFLVKTGFKFRSGKGAYLRKAIEDGFAPPTGYAEAVKAESLQSEQLAHQKAQVAHGETKRRCLRETLARLKIEQPNAFTDFSAYVELKKQAALSKPILDKAPEVKERLIRAFESEGNRLALLEEYLLLSGDGAPDLQRQDDLYDPFEDD